MTEDYILNSYLFKRPLPVKLVEYAPHYRTIRTNSYNFQGQETINAYIPLIYTQLFFTGMSILDFTKNIDNCTFNQSEFLSLQEAVLFTNSFGYAASGSKLYRNIFGNSVNCVISRKEESCFVSDEIYCDSGTMKYTMIVLDHGPIVPGSMIGSICIGNFIVQNFYIDKQGKVEFDKVSNSAIFATDIKISDFNMKIYWNKIPGENSVSLNYEFTEEADVSADLSALCLGDKERPEIMNLSIEATCNMFWNTNFGDSNIFKRLRYLQPQYGKDAYTKIDLRETDLKYQCLKVK